MDDPYAVVRFMAHRSLRQIPGYEGLEFNYTGSNPERAAVLKRVQETWLRAGLPEETLNRSELLLGEGGLNTDALNALLKRRNHRDVRLSE